MGMMASASVLISFGGLIIRSIEEAGVWQILVWRSCFLILVVGMLMVARYGSHAPATIRGIGRPGLLAGLLLGGATISFLQSITHTTVANTLFLLGTVPFFTAAMAWVILKEVPSRATLLTMVAAAGGIVVMVTGGIGAGSIFGNLMGLSTALCFSGYAVVVRRHREVEMQPTLVVAGSFVLSVALIMTRGDVAIPLIDVFYCFLLGGVLSGAANISFILAAKHLVAAELTLFLLLEVALGPVWVWLFVGEVPLRATLIGGSIVITAVLLRALSELRRGTRARTPPPAP